LTTSKERFSNQNFDVVIDMICFNPDQAENTVNTLPGDASIHLLLDGLYRMESKCLRAFSLDESFPQEPSAARQEQSGLRENISRCPRCRQIQNHDHPSQSPTARAPLIDNLETDPVSWDRIERGKPILCSAMALVFGFLPIATIVQALRLCRHESQNIPANPTNATRDGHMTWRDYLHQVAAS